MNKALSWAENNRILVLFLIFGFSLVVRFLTAEYLDLGGDNAARWMESHRIAEGLGVTQWYNHSMRWTIILPLVGLIKLFGPHPALTYVQPFFYASLTAVIVFLIGERLHSVKLGLATAILTILYPQMAQTGSQIWPGVFEMFYITLMMWLILVWVDTQKKRYLVFAGMAFFVGWGARVIILYAYPGAALLIWMTTRNFRAIVLFTAVASGLCYAEWGYFWFDTGNPMGRIGLLHTTRGSDPALIVSLSDYLLSIKQLVKLKGLLPVMILTLVASAFAFREEDKRWQGISLFYLIFLFLTFYMISGLSPLKSANPFGARNWPACAPFGFMMLLLMLIRLQERYSKTAITLTAILFLAFAVFSIKKIPPTPSVIQMSRDYAILEPITAAGKPILMRYEPWQPNLIEKIIIEVFTGRTKRKERSDEAISVDMFRNRHRISSLFLTDVTKFMDWKKTKAERIEKYVYLFRPPGTPEDVPPAAESIFGRKLHEARLLP